MRQVYGATLPSDCWYVPGLQVKKATGVGSWRQAATVSVPAPPKG